MRLCFISPFRMDSNSTHGSRMIDRLHLLGSMLLLFLISVPTALRAQDNFWRNTNPFDGTIVTALAVGPDGLIVAGLESSPRLLLSRDNGRSWSVARAYGGYAHEYAVAFSP